jgi:hypothetical protein
MELSTVVPDYRSYVGPLADIRLFARGHKTTEPLSQPLVWFSSEGYSAHYYLITESTDIEEGHARKVPEVSGDSCLLLCTFEDALLDCFRRRYKMVVEGRLIWDAALLWHEHELLNTAMTDPETEDNEIMGTVRKRILQGIEHACRRFYDLCNAIRRY